MKKVKVLVLNPPYFKKFSRSQRSPAVTKSGTLYYPIWLSYATGVLEQDGFEVKLIDAPARNYSLSDILNFVENYSPRMIVCDSSTPSIENDLNVVNSIKKIMPEAFTVLVGPHASALPDECLEFASGLDGVVRREYDSTLSELGKTIKSGGALESVLGLSFKNGKKIIHNPDRPLIEDLDQLPLVSSVYKKHLNIEDYFNPNAPYPNVTIITGRGCVYRCNFCLFPQTLHGRKYRTRSADNVVAEFEYIKKTFRQCKAVFIEDDTFTVNRKRCQEISEKLINSKVGLCWTANSRADLDFETMKIMKEAGCRSLCVGVESGDQKILDNVGKGITINQIKKFMRNSKKAGLLVHGCFIAGLPGETNETLKKTLKLAKELNPDTVQFYPFMVYPGTKAYKSAERNGFIRANNYSEWLTKEGLHSSIIATDRLSSKEVVDFCDKARRSFYLRPSYLTYKLSQIVKNPYDLQRTVKSFWKFSRYIFRNTYDGRAGK